MAEIGIITFYFMNYGAILQAYALQQTLNDIGFAAEIIDYHNKEFLIAHLSPIRRLRHFIWNGLVKRIIAGRKQQLRMESFCREHIRLSPNHYSDMKTLYSNPPLYDTYITGSDQVWNPITIFHDSSYLLTFVPSRRKRVSYAASFGVSRLDDIYTSIYAGPLKKIDVLSVREREGKDIVKQITGRDAEVVLDPTLLLDQERWRKIAVPYKFSKPYILCYHMPGDREVSRGIVNTASKISALTGWEVINIGQKEYMRLNPWRRSIFDAGPAEYLGLFQSASFVVTNSFHGTAFAVNYRKPFYAFINRNVPPKKSLESRITTLLNTLGLEDRLLFAGKAFADEDIFNIDYQPSEIILQKERQRSIDFLKNALRKA